MPDAILEDYFVYYTVPGAPLDMKVEIVLKLCSFFFRNFKLICIAEIMIFFIRTPFRNNNWSTATTF
jgi:hypothetical protein